MRERLFDESPGEPQECKAAIIEGSENAGSEREAYEPAFIQAFGPGPSVLISQLSSGPARSLAQPIEYGGEGDR